jgi:hypothetical protein
VLEDMARGFSMGRSPQGSGEWRGRVMMMHAWLAGGASSGRGLTPGILGGAARHRLRAILALAVIVGPDELDLGALLEALAILDAGKVAEDIFATVVRHDETEALFSVPAFGSA